MAKAVWNNTIIAESDETIMVEGNHYFPPSAVKQEFLQDNAKQSRCFWKGTASYYDIVVNGDTNTGAAWYYPEPMEQAEHIKDYVAFWGGVRVSE